jgi:uncharacterized protein YlxP (DUF503 family)
VLTFVFLALKEKLSIVKQILTVTDAHFALALAQLIEIELTIFAHSGDSAIV